MVKVCRFWVYEVGYSVVILLLFSAASPVAALTTDGLALLALKSAISSDPSGALDSWSESDSDPCSWPGVTCQSGRVTALAIFNRSLSGYLPSELSLLSSLETLTLPYNLLSGPIPTAISALRDLAVLDLSNNLLSGPIPAGIGSLGSISRLDLSSNLLNGSLPSAIATLPRLSGVLNLSFNNFYGGIPPEFGSIPVAVSLDLRRNNLSGEIPQVGSLVNQGPTAFAGNPGLCGFPLKNPCSGLKQDPRIAFPVPSFNPSAATAYPIEPEKQRRKSAATIPILAAVVIAALISVLVLQWQFRRRRAAMGEVKESKNAKDGTIISEERREGQEGEVFEALDEGFALELEELLRASAYVVGKSRSGIVYKVVAGRGPAVAVRRLSEPDDGDSGVAPVDEWRRRRGFESEVIAIGRVNHPNVVRLRAYYYAPDEKLLIYDYISNGTLHASLHGGPLNPTAPVLSWAARLSIVQGAARGLAYLHECSPRKYVHGSIKSSKILLDDELHPYISGFGLTRLVSVTQKLTHSGSKKLGPGGHVRGGPQSYVAPESRVPGSAVTQKGDVYSFGVVLLEVVTGRVSVPGADGEVGELEGWVRRAFKDERPLSEVVDPALLHEVHAKRQVLSVFHVALGCTEPDPDLRPRIRAVSEALDRIG